jgi:hypothetical protein
MAKLKSIHITVENVALGDVLDKLDGMPGVVKIDLNMQSNKTLMPANSEDKSSNVRQGISIQEGVLKLLSDGEPKRFKEIKEYIGGPGHRANGAVHQLKSKGWLRQPAPTFYQITALGLQQLPVELQAVPAPKALPKPSTKSNGYANGHERAPKGLARDFLLDSLSDGPRKIAQLTACQNDAQLMFALKPAIDRAKQAKVVKSDGKGTYELTTTGKKAAAELASRKAATLQQGA